MKLRIPLVLICIALLTLAGCSTSPEKSPAFMKLQKQVSDLEQAQKASKSSIEQLYFDVDGLTQDIANVKAQLQAIGANPESQQQLATALRRLDQIEQQMKSVAEAAAKRSAEQAAARSRATTAPSAPSKAAPRPARVEEPVKPKGFYYRVKSGDTLQSVARAQGVSSAVICRANNLPMTAVLIPGQSIFIPKE